MKSHFSLALLISLALPWVAAGPLSYAAPRPVPQAKPSISPHAYNTVPEADVQYANSTLIHLARRGCTFSSEKDSWTCDGSIPPVEEMIDQMQRKGNVGKKVSAFYTKLNGPSGMDVSKAWMNAHRDLVPCKPGAVMYDEIVDEKWLKAVANAMTGASGMSRVVRFQKYISQVMAEQSKGRAWIFAPANVDFDNLEQDNTWAHWEFPALTQNLAITEVVRTDPNASGDPPSLTTIWRQGDPTQAPRGLEE